MIGRAACIALAFALAPAPLRAQDTRLTISVDSADVFKGPSNVTPVIGQVSRGTVLPVVRNLGSWVRVPWPAAADGVGYVHVSMGRLTGAAVTTTTPTTTTTTTAAPRAGLRPVPSNTPIAAAPTSTDPAGPRAARRGGDAPPANHAFGIGAVAMSTSNFGGTMRAWRTNRIGAQFDFTRERITNDLTRTTFTQIEPGLVYGLMDKVTDYVWIRPYVGSVASWRRETVAFASADTLAPPAETRFGFRVFGGAELTFASVPQFGISADAGYRRYSTPFSGYDIDPFSISVAGHWYIR